MDRAARASRSYIDFLLEKLRASYREERRRIARELHDRVAHGMGLVAQNLELYRQYLGRDAERAQAKLTAAVGAVGDALRTVRQLSAELRRSVGTAGIQQALQMYLLSTVPATVQATLQFSGDAAALPPPVSEELYLIVREATWNALRHADATELHLAMTVTETAVIATVADDGRGFEIGGVAETRGSGLLTMAERAHLLNGTVQISSELGKGTTVTVRVPLAGGIR
jgi:signal transduction histidine kinase